MTTTWKSVERRVARAVGGERVGCTGGAAPDVVAGDWLKVEVKHRKALPQWLKSALAQAHQHAGERQLAVAVLHERGRRISDSLVLLSLSDFQEWFSEAEGQDKEALDV